MLGILEILSQYLIMTFGGFFTSFIVSKIMREVEIENKIMAAIAAVIFSGVISGIAFLVFIPNLIFLQIGFLFAAFCLFLAFISEKGSLAKTIMTIVASLAIYLFISWIYLPLPTGIILAFVFFLCGSLASFEEESKILFPILAFLLTVTAPFLTRPVIAIVGIDIPMMCIVYIVLFGILIFAAIRGEIGKPGLSSILILLPITIIFFFFPTSVPGISPETLWYGGVAAREFARQTQLYRRYLEIYRRLQQNETLRKLYGAGEYELPEEQSFLLESNRGLIISYKEEDILKLWEGNRITVEIMGRIENPLENPVQVLILPEILKVEGVDINGLYCEDSNFNWSVTCTFMKEELSGENSLLGNILNNWDKGGGDIEIVYKKSFEPFECKINITNANTFNSNCNLSSNVTKIYFDLKIYILYDMYTSSIIELDLMGKEKYTSLLRFEKLKEKDLVSYSTWGPLKGIIRVFGYEKNPIPVEEIGKTLSVYLYTISYVPSGNASMRCYIFAVPIIEGINITQVPEGCEKVNDTSVNISEECGIDITKAESLYYGFPIYTGYFDEIWNDYHIYVCKDKNWGDFKYRGDPMISKEIKVFKIKVTTDPREEILIFPQAHYIYVFRDLKEIPVVVKR